MIFWRTPVVVGYPLVGSTTLREVIPRVYGSASAVLGGVRWLSAKSELAVPIGRATPVSPKAFQVWQEDHGAHLQDRIRRDASCWLRTRRRHSRDPESCGTVRRICGHHNASGRHPVEQEFWWHGMVAV